MPFAAFQDLWSTTLRFTSQFISLKTLKLLIMEVLESMNIRSMCRLCAREVEGLMDLFSSNTPGHIEATLIIETVYNCTSVKV